jgi:hypothetical protein
MLDTFGSHIIRCTAEWDEFLFEKVKKIMRKIKRKRNLLCYFVKHQIDIETLALRIDCIQYQVWWVSVQKRENRYEGYEERKAFTKLFRKPLARYWTPSSEIPQEEISSVVNAYVKSCRRKLRETDIYSFFL